MKIETIKKAQELLLEIQRIEETIDALYGIRIKENEEKYKSSWNITINGFSVILTNSTFMNMVESLKDKIKELQTEFEKL